MDQGQETTTTTTSYKNKTKILVWLAAVISILAVASHNFFPTKVKEVFQQESKYKGLVNERKGSSAKLEKYYLSNSDLNSKEFKTLLDEYFTNKNAADKEYKILKDVRKRNKVFGFNSVNTFLFQTSVFFVIFILSILLKFITLQIEIQYLRNTYKVVSFTFILISCYYLVWSFYDKSDLEPWQHLLAILLIATVISCLSIMVVKWIHLRSSIISQQKKRLISEKKKVGGLVDFILDIRNNYFKKLAIKAMEIEQDETLDTVIDFENKTEKELSKIVS